MPDSRTDRFGERLQDAITKCSAIFDRRHVAHALIGGLAFGLRGRPRATLDIDLIVSVPQLQLAAVLDDFVAEGFAPSTIDLIKQWNQGLAVLWYEDVRVDWLRPVLPIYQHVIDRSEPLQIAEHPFHVATTEGLILCKMIANRPRDRADIWELLIARAGEVDLDYIETEWQTIGSLSDPTVVELRRAIEAIRSGEVT